MRTWTLKNNKYKPESAFVHIFTYGSLSDGELIPQICFQEQGLGFLRYLIENLQSSDEDQPHHTVFLGLSLRAALVKMYVTGIAAVVEAVLVDVGKKRGYKIPDNESVRTFGKALKAWDIAGKCELASVWVELQTIYKYRNFLHLGNAARNKDAYWGEIIVNEKNIFSACDKSMNAISVLTDTEGAKYIKSSN